MTVPTRLRSRGPGPHLAVLLKDSLIMKVLILSGVTGGLGGEELGAGWMEWVNGSTLKGVSGPGTWWWWWWW